MDTKDQLKEFWDASDYKALLTTMHSQGAFPDRQWPAVCWSTTGSNTLACPIKPVAPATKAWATLTIPSDPFQREYDVEITLNLHAHAPNSVNWVNNSDQQHVFKRVVSRETADEIVSFAKSLG